MDKDESSQPGTPTPYPQPELKPKKNNLLSLLISILVTAIISGAVGFVLGKQSNKTNSFSMTDTGGTDPSSPTATPLPSASDISPTMMPEFTPSPALPGCKDIDGLIDYQFCKDSNHLFSDYIIGPSSVKVEHVSRYSLSPNKAWLFIVRYSDEYAKTGGAPDENALSIVDIDNSQVTELFSQIYFPNYTDESWSPAGDGIVFTAGEAAIPDILGNPNMFSVVYCTISCRVLAKNAGPAGIGGDPAYFAGNKVHYTGMNGGPIEIPFN